MRVCVWAMTQEEYRDKVNKTEVVYVAKIGKWKSKKNLDKVREWASNKENTIAAIARKMNISPSTFYNWMKEYEEFREAFEDGRRCVDEEVETSFFKMCTGYKESVSEKKTVTNSKGEETVEVEKEIYIPPNVAALKLYLVNRMPKKYRPENAVLPAEKDDENNTGVVMLPKVEEPGEVVEAEIVENAECGVRSAE